MTNRPTYRCPVCSEPATKDAAWQSKQGRFLRVCCHDHGHVTTLNGELQGKPERSGPARAGTVTPAPYATGFRWFFRRSGS